MNETLDFQRLDELHQLLQDRELSLFSRRLLDLISDFPQEVNFRTEAIMLRAKYNEYASREASQQSPLDFEDMLEAGSALLVRLEEFLPEIPDDVLMAMDSNLPFDRPVFHGKGLSKTFKTRSHTFQLPKADVRLNPGEITGIVGENGNGKTTLMRIIAGSLQADAGSLSYWGKDHADWGWYEIKRKLAFIPQHLEPWTGLLKDNLHFSAAIHGIKGAENEDLVDYAIHRLGLSQYEHSTWKEISSGYKLRFELARALVRRPSLLIIDEPLANLDINTQQIFLQDLRYIADSHSQPVSILVSSQHLHEIESISDNLLFIKSGELLYNGPTSEFGQDRTENLFELETSMDRAEVEQRLAHLEGVSFKSAGSKILIAAPLDMTIPQLMGELAQQNIPVQYFRDISQSTLKLFRDNA
ncbi:ABC transporter ATP-binding protein [Pontibacter sp. G13]|uniref:ABC transporter ATP-binding protein n=1 Tax=Pontibacter sp. G13 TaxID=3074898 RepID=UPI0028894EF7|nr:ABC transporter ATP-binding protein [Pontibacter sp. G13]WNJ16308.1 ABC transporter ATP-binding protein [Pontibacter sp. G13]